MRAAIFIDGGYIQNQFKQYRIEPNWEDLADYFLEPLRHKIPLDLLRCYYYYCPPYMSQEPTEDELSRMEAHEEFVEEIENLDRWSMRLGKLQKRWDGKKEFYEQKRVDVLLSVDLVRHAAAGHIQHAVLVAGDSDFVPAVDAAKDHGVTLSLWCGNFNTVHKDLIALADEVHTFDWDDFPKVINPQEQANKAAKSKPERQRRDSRQSQNRSSSSDVDGQDGGQGQQGARRRRPRRRRPKSQNQQGGSQDQNDNQQNHTAGGGRKKSPPSNHGRQAPVHHKPATIKPAVGWAARLRRFTGLD